VIKNKIFLIIIACLIIIMSSSTVLADFQPTPFRYLFSFPSACASGEYISEMNSTSYVCSTPSAGSTTFYNTTSITEIIGTPQGTIADIQSYDSIPYNVSEVGSDIDFRINFTGMTEFNQFVIRYKTDSTERHIVTVYLWDYDSTSWESYLNLGQTDEYTILESSIFDYADHVSGGVVQMRIYGVAGGGSTHKYNFDWITMSKGLATPSSSEIDPFSVYADGSRELTSNWDVGLFNITASYFSGNMAWSNLTSYPAVCPANTFLTGINDSTTCTGISDVYLLNSGDEGTGNYVFTGYINQTLNGTIRNFGNGCSEISNSTGVFIVC